MKEHVDEKQLPWKLEMGAVTQEVGSTSKDVEVVGQDGRERVGSVGVLACWRVVSGSTVVKSNFMHAVDSWHSCFADDEEGCGNLRNAVEDVTSVADGI